MWVQSGCRLWLCLPAFFACPSVQVVGSLCYFADVSKIVLMLRLLSALPLCAWCIILKYASISRFKGVFSAVWGCCVGLCCLGWFAWLVWLLYACGVRRIRGLRRVCLYFPSSLPSFFLFFVLLLSLCSSCPLLILLPCLCSLCGSLCFLFPFRTIRKKKGRAVLVRPLFVGCGLY